VFVPKSSSGDTNSSKRAILLCAAYIQSPWSICSQYAACISPQCGTGIVVTTSVIMWQRYAAGGWVWRRCTRIFVYLFKYTIFSTTPHFYDAYRYIVQYKSTLEHVPTIVDINIPYLSICYVNHKRIAVGVKCVLCERLNQSTLIVKGVGIYVFKLQFESTFKKRLRYPCR